MQRLLSFTAAPSPLGLTPAMSIRMHAPWPTQRRVPTNRAPSRQQMPGIGSRSRRSRSAPVRRSFSKRLRSVDGTDASFPPNLKRWLHRSIRMRMALLTLPEVKSRQGRSTPE